MSKYQEDILQGENEELKREIKNNKILWLAAIKTNGKLIINDCDIVSIKGREEIHRFNDGIHNRIVFTIK